MRYSITPLILFSLLFSIACSKSEPATPPSGATPDEASAAPTEASTTPDEPAVKPDDGAKVEPSIQLSAAGAEPRRVLLRTFEVGAKETAKIQSQVTMIAHLGVGNQQKTVVPPILHTLALEVRSVQADGTATVGFEVIRSEVLPEKEATADIRAKMEAAAASMPGLKGTYRIDAQGVITAVELAEPAADERRDPHMAESIGEFIYRSTVPVPSEAVGRGGKWVLKRRLKEGGILTDQTYAYEVKKIDGSNIVVAVAIKKGAPDQKVGAPDAFDLELFAVKGDGRLDVELDRLAPRLAASETETELLMTRAGPSGTAIQNHLTVKTEERITRP
jgi:hypothetical protein